MLGEERPFMTHTEFRAKPTLRYEELTELSRPTFSFPLCPPRPRASVEGFTIGVRERNDRYERV
jgi:hypothetical protein